MHDRSFLEARRLWVAALGLLTLAGPGAGSAWAQAEGTVLRVVGSADPPYRVFAPEGATGLYFDLLREAARRLGWPLSFQEVPSARAFKMMEAGEADVMLGPLMTPERQRFLSYTRIQLPAEDKAFYARPEAAPVRRLRDLEGRLIAVQRGKRYGSAFDGLTSLRLLEVNDYRVALEMVALGRVDLAVLPERQAEWLLRQRPLPLLKQALRLPGESGFLVLSSRSPWRPRQAELEQAFQSLHEDGSWRRMVSAYR